MRGRGGAIRGGREDVSQQMVRDPARDLARRREGRVAEDRDGQPLRRKAQIMGAEGSIAPGMFGHVQPPIAPDRQAEAIAGWLPVQEQTGAMHRRDQYRRTDLRLQQMPLPGGEIGDGGEQSRRSRRRIGGVVDAQRAVRRARIGVGPPAKRQVEGIAKTGPVHPQRREQRILGEGPQRHAGDALDRSREDRVAAVDILEARARREVQRALPATQPEDIGVALHVLVPPARQIEQPPLIAQSAAMVEDLVRRDGPDDRDFREQRPQRLIEVQHPALGKQSDAERRHLLRQRRDVKHRIGGDRHAMLDIGQPEAAQQQRLAVAIDAQRRPGAVGRRPVEQADQEIGVNIG